MLSLPQDSSTDMNGCQSRSVTGCTQHNQVIVFARPVRNALAWVWLYNVFNTGLTPVDSVMAPDTPVAIKSRLKRLLVIAAESHWLAYMPAAAG